MVYMLHIIILEMNTYVIYVYIWDKYYMCRNTEAIHV